MSGYLVTSVRVWVAVATVGLLQSTGAFAQSPEGEPLGPGIVTAADVYVRSGASMNHYPIVKLQAADRVTIVGAVADWYEIVPPADAFSWISEKYIDTVDQRTGVVNGDNVRVRAGSMLSDYASSRYAVQTLLSRGAEVTILGQSPDGFLKIKPPSGTTAWINRRFIERATGDSVGVEAPGKEDDVDSPRTLVKDRVDEAFAERPVAGKVTEPVASALEALESTSERTELRYIDGATEAVLARPITKRDFGPVLKRYATIAGQHGDNFARRYALARMKQVNDMQSLVEATRTLRRLDEESDSQRRKYFEARAAIDVVMPTAPIGLDAKGELRLSAIYPADSHPRRYRLVDPTSPHGRTVGYVEVTADSGLDGEAFLGQYVGIRAARKWLLAGSVDPMPIYQASEIVSLSRERYAGEAESDD